MCFIVVFVICDCLHIRVSIWSTCWLLWFRLIILSVKTTKLPSSWSSVLQSSFQIWFFFFTNSPVSDLQKQRINSITYFLLTPRTFSSCNGYHFKFQSDKINKFLIIFHSHRLFYNFNVFFLILSLKLRMYSYFNYLY